MNPFIKSASSPSTSSVLQPQQPSYSSRHHMESIATPVGAPRSRRLRKASASNTKKAFDFPVFIALLAFAFNLLNSYLQARLISHYGNYERDQWFWWRFAGGFAVFVLGMTMNARADMVLLGLKTQGGGYKIPRGGWFEVVSCPNYFWELVEWLSWAVMTWSWAGLGFFLYTCANLVPRARANHRWYLQKFGEDYPKGRKAVIPFLI